MWTIALKTLLADRGKLFTALVGVVFSVVLVNIQGGLFLGLIRKAALLVDQADADIWVGHRAMHTVDFGADIPARWIDRVRSVPGVKRAEPYLVGYGMMTLPSGASEPVTLIGVDAKTLLGGAQTLISGTPAAIRRPNAVFVDEGDDDKLERPAVGEIREISGRRARIVGKTQGVMGFTITPYLFTTYERAAEYGDKSIDKATFFLVELDPGANANDVCRAIRARVPELDVLTRNQFARACVTYWMTRTGLGISFGAATLMGLVIGLVMVGQTLYSMVLDRLSEFGALKAIGATDRQVYSILFTDAVTMAISGSVLGLVIVALLQNAYSSPKAPILIPSELSTGSSCVVLLICLVSSMLPYLRVRKVDPMLVLRT